MNSLREWRTLREIERSLAEDDPQLIEHFRIAAPSPRWHERTLLRVGMFVASAIIVAAALMISDPFLMALGLLCLLASSMVVAASRKHLFD